ncbi:GyrI-like domain-containing protein [Paenibacillus aurantiacus]|uniref:GyrI-like domain-containing protein n=1 Tax=Paenibacillus aurantiacus TaxID=1936118 RepID=A0ABV5KSC6_9BACL
MQPQVVHLPARQIIGVGSIGGEPVNPGDVWPVLFTRMGELTGRINERETLGLIKRSQHGYLAGVETELSSRVPEGMFAYAIPAGEYVSLTHRGPVSRINDTFERLISWLTSNGYEPYDVVCFEVYDERFRGEDDTSEFDIYVQVRPA